MMDRLLYTFLLGISIMIMSACGSSPDARVCEADTVAAITVDELMESPDSYVGKRVTVIGNCDHYGRYAGRRAFVSGEADSVWIRCDATASSGVYPVVKYLGHNVSVTGLMQEQRIDEQYLERLHQRYDAGFDDQKTNMAASVLSEDLPPLVDKRDSGANADSLFHESLEKYRARIHQRLETEGKNYLSFYYIDVIYCDPVE